VPDASEPAEAVEDAEDWRAAVIKGDFNAGLTERLLTQAFASEIEKHLAIQCVAVVAGNCDKLANWHWRVWRKPEEYGYPFVGKDRYPEDGLPQALQSSLYKMIVAASPLLVRVFRERFTTAYLAGKLKLPANGVEGTRKPLPWNDGLLGAANFRPYADLIAERRYQVFHLSGLGASLFYEGGARALYLDADYYAKLPPSHVFHRVMGVLWSVRIHTFVPLALSPQKHVLPVLVQMHQFFGAQGLSKIKSKLTAGSAVAKVLGKMDTRQLRSLHEKVGLPTEEQLNQVWDGMRQHLLRLMLAETLDVVGIVETLLAKDVTRPNAMKHSEVFAASPQAKALLEFATKLRV
jgi:hypothetical protein